MSPRILDWSTIAPCLDTIDCVEAMAEAFVAYSAGRAVIPPVGELQFIDPPGDTHIKYGYLRGGEYYVVKIASGFYENPQRGLSSSQGLMLLFSQSTGQLKSVLLDDGRLTDERTGAAGALATRTLAPAHIEAVGVIGAGIQARQQIKHLKRCIECRRLHVWSRSQPALAAFAEDARVDGWEVYVESSAEAVARASNVIITTTPSTLPLLKAQWIRPGTHITAVGSDTHHKQELDTKILAKADLVVADSLSQCLSRGEIHHAISQGDIDQSHVVELGMILSGGHPSRSDERDITVCDLTGVAVQDLEIATAVYACLCQKSQDDPAT